MDEVDNARRSSEPPSLLDRIAWVYSMVEQHGLTVSQGAVLHRLAYRAATGVVWESQPVIAKAIGSNRSTAQRSLKRLVDLGLIAKRRRFSAPNLYFPQWDSLVQTLLLPQRDATGPLQGEAPPPQREATGASERRGLTLNGNSEKEEEKKGIPDTEQIKKMRNGAGTQHPTADGLWQSVLAELEKCVPGPTFDTYLVGTVGLTLERGPDRAVLVVETPNSFVSEMLERRMYSLISQGVEEVLGRPVAVSFKKVGR